MYQTDLGRTSPCSYRVLDLYISTVVRKQMLGRKETLCCFGTLGYVACWDVAIVRAQWSATYTLVVTLLQSRPILIQLALSLSNFEMLSTIFVRPLLLRVDAFHPGDAISMRTVCLDDIITTAQCLQLEYLR